ncbi:M24 family metallopeptidase [Pelagibacterium limicola]|uniref:M24 family metallopeptidase n=1 Tax=Pelagibacterium limicola TaxID=2791022 RepID=UPI0018AF5D4E|nr:M24 family metallopeptidase [Pelagibacterium limicola]
MLEEHNLDCLVLFGYKSHDHYDCYLTNEQFDGAVILPREGEPIAFTALTQRLTRRLASNLPGEFWVNDVRIGRYGPQTVSVLKELGLERGRIGVFGLDSWGPGEFDGLVPYRMWQTVLEGLPGAEFVDISVPFKKMMLKKSAEEIELYRFSGKIGDIACRAMLEATAEGVPETEIYAAVQHAIFRNGADAWWPHLNLTVGADDIGWGPPIWIYRGGEPRRVRQGDLVQAEIFPCYGGAETQQQMSIAVGPVPDLHYELGEVASKSLAEGANILKAGVTLGEVAQAMFAPIRENPDYWTLSPLVHTLGPGPFVSNLGYNIENSPARALSPRVAEMTGKGQDTVLEAGMIIAFEPNVCKGQTRVNIGGTVIVTKTGFEDLNTLPNRLNVV